MEKPYPTALKKLNEQYQQVHKSQHYGSSGNYRAKWILPYINFNPKTVLDYGCGKCNLVNTLKIKEVYRYDPGVSKFCKRPKKTQFDLVICTDVLEHIPEDNLDFILNDIKNYSNYVFFIICTRIAAKILPNGLNAHRTIKSAKWWLKKIKNYFEYGELLLVNNHGCHIKTWN